MSMKFCPRCGRPLQNQLIETRERPVCDKNVDGCGFIDFGRYSLGVGGVVVQTGPDGLRRALLIQRNEEPNKGGWTIPGGFVEYDEPAHLGVLREVEEETGLVCQLIGLVGFRNRPDPDDNNSYAVFLLEAIGGELLKEPNAEIAQAGFYTVAEMQQIERLAPLSFALTAAAIENRLQVLTSRTIPGLPGRPVSTLFM